MYDGLAQYNECLVLGGNRSGKTTGCAKLLMKAVTENQNGHVICFSQNIDTSIKIQQKAVWDMMPKEFRRKTKSTEAELYLSRYQDQGRL
jgi:hypothetical protein